MSDAMREWAVVERKFIQDDIYWLKAGAKLTSPSGENITDKKLVELKARLEHANLVLNK